MSKPKANPTEIQRWGDRLRDAKLQLDFARIYVKEVERDYPAGQVPTPDGNFARQHALRSETLTLAEYNRILRIYTCLVLDGEVPDETDWLRRKAANASRSENDA